MTVKYQQQELYHLHSMIYRYDNIATKKDDSGKTVVKPALYPPIPRSADDIYVRTTPGDRLDLLANNYYGSVGYWWIIAEANGIGKGTMTIPPNQQLRIPASLSQILSDYKELNK